MARVVRNNSQRINDLIINFYINLSPLMASVEVSKLSTQEKAELACTYAALILHDDDQEITGTHYLI